jgi:hypothetical protein
MSRKKASNFSTFVESQNGAPVFVGMDVHKMDYHVAFRGGYGMVESFVTTADPKAFTRKLLDLGFSISMIAYEVDLTGFGLAQSLLEAHQRGVKVEAILDKSQKTARYTGATFLTNAGIPVFIDSAHSIAHNKIIVLDGETEITGSFNFTKAADEKNAENLLVVSSKELAALYLDNWKLHRSHAEKY